MAESCRIDTERYKAVLFDLDGVITDTMGMHYEAYRQAFKKYGIDVSPPDIYLREGMPSMEVGREIVEAKGSHLSDDQIRKLIDEKREIYRSIASKNVSTYPGVKETLKMLREKGVRLALITGSNLRSVTQVIKDAGLEGAFDAIVTGDETPRGKPHPDPYLKGMEKLAMAPENCVVVENAPLGVQSASAAGTGYIIAVTTTLPEQYLKDADDVMSSFTEIEECLARRLSNKNSRPAGD